MALPQPCWFEPTRLRAHAFGFRCLAFNSGVRLPNRRELIWIERPVPRSAHLTLLAGDFVPAFQDSARAGSQRVLVQTNTEEEEVGLNRTEPADEARSRGTWMKRAQMVVPRSTR